MLHELKQCRLPAGYVLPRATGAYVTEKDARMFYDDKANLVWVIPLPHVNCDPLTYFAAGMELRFKEVPQSILSALEGDAARK